MNFRALDVGVSVASKVWHRITEPGTETLRPWLRTALRLMPGPLQRGALQGLGAVRALTWFEPFHISTMGMHSKPRAKLFPLEVEPATGRAMENGHWLGGQGPRTGGFLKPYTTSAHSAGDTAYIVSECNVAYMGDLLMHTATPIQWHGPASAFIEAIDDVLGMEPTIEYFVPGHGPILDRAGAKEVRAYWKYVRELGKACFRSGMRSEVCAGRALRNLPRPFNAWDNPERMYQNIAVEVAHLEKGVGPNPEGRLLAFWTRGAAPWKRASSLPARPSSTRTLRRGVLLEGGGLAGTPGGRRQSFGTTRPLWSRRTGRRCSSRRRGGGSGVPPRGAPRRARPPMATRRAATRRAATRRAATRRAATSQTPDGDEESSDEESSDEESSDEESSDGESGEEDYDDDDPEDSSEEDSSEEEEDQAETRAATSTG